MQFGYIFDFDGVLVDTMAAHFEMYREALAGFGVPINRAQFYHQAGMTGREQIRYFAGQAGISVNADEVYRRKREIQQRGGASGEVIPSNIELLNLLRSSGGKAAIASGSSRDSVLTTMRLFGIEADAVVTAEDVTRGKPNPDLFLLSARKLEIEPRCCIVIEDSAAGVQAAQAAGMKVFHFIDNRLPTAESDAASS